MLEAVPAGRARRPGRVGPGRSEDQQPGVKGLAEQGLSGGSAQRGACDSVRVVLSGQDAGQCCLHDARGSLS